MRKIDLLISDNEFGTHEFGFIHRNSGCTNCDCDDKCISEDKKYIRYLKTKGVNAKVVFGAIYVDDNFVSFV